MAPDEAAAAERRLYDVLEGLGPIAIAVSGGVDSMTLAFLAHRAGPVQMVHALSPAVPGEASERVRRYAERFGWHLATTRAGEFSDPDYLRNPVNRCFYCKSNLYDRIAELTPLPIASGANLDDLSDYRPGLVAAADRKVVHPLVAAGIDKQTVRMLARHHGLDDLAELPAQPCLSSRIETGIGIKADDLAFVHRVETRMRGFFEAGTDLRCRITRDGVVLELAAALDDGRAPAAIETARRMAEDSGRLWCGARRYRRGSAFIGARPVLHRD